MYKINKIAKTIFLLSLSGVSGSAGSHDDPFSQTPSQTTLSTDTSSGLRQQIDQLTERIQELTEAVQKLEGLVPTVVVPTVVVPTAEPEVVPGDEVLVVTARGVAGELSSAAMSAATTIVIAAARGIAITLVSTGSGLSELDLTQTKGAAKAMAGATLKAGTQLLMQGKEAVVVIGEQILEAVRATAIKAGSAVVARIRTAPAQA